MLLLMSAIWLVLLLGDVLIGIVRPLVTTSDYPATRHARNAVLWLGAWMLMTPVIVALAQRVHPDRVGLGRAVVAHLVALPCFIAIQLAVVAIAFRLITGYDGSLLIQWKTLLFGTTARDVAMYAVVVGVVLLIEAATRSHVEAARSARLEAERAQLQELAAEARIEALRRELDPHFMANALNSVAACVREERRDAALQMLESIGDLLRASFRRGRDARVALAEEIDLLELYVGIQRERVGDRMSFEIATDPDLLDALVPTLLLQPIVENAVRHAVDRHAGPVAIQVDVRQEGSQLVLVVSDRASGPAPTRSQDATEHTGLANSRERLALLYGPRASLAVHLDRADGARVEIRLPLARELHTAPVSGERAS